MEKNNTKPFWKYVKSRKQDNIGIAPLKERGHLINNSEEKAQILIKQFSSVFTRVKVNKCLKHTEESNKTFQASKSHKME
jgi:hypothetical protein